jgi:hypothetical protein
VRDLARTGALDALPRLLRMAASRTAQLFNLSDLATSFQLSRVTIGDYVTLLEHVFLLERLPPWHSNRSSRLVSALLETFAYQELRRLASGHEHEHDFYHSSAIVTGWKSTSSSNATRASLPE